MVESGSSAPRWAGCLVGVASAAVGLAVGELVAAAASVRSPLVAVGDRVVDVVPTSVRSWAISTFGTDDKTVLMAGVLVVLVIAAALLGIVAVQRSEWIGAAGVAVFALVGLVAQLGRGDTGALRPLPSLAAGIVSAGTLVVLARRAGRVWQSTRVVEDGRPIEVERRRFLQLGAGLMGAAVIAGAAGRWLQQQAAVVAERLKVVLPRPASPLPAIPAAVHAEGAVPFVTPNSDFYRIDTALSVPRVSPDGWTLTVRGKVDRELTLTFAELLRRPMIEADITISCVSNEVGGEFIGTARWLGCRLDDLLHEAGIRPDADQVVGRSVDGFTAGFPTTLLDGRPALVAVGMNGEPLPIEHGFPARLVVPGVYGYVSATKWLREIELTRFDEFDAYWIPRGWSRLGPIKTESRIDTPTDGATVVAGRPTAIAGVAWAMDRGIEMVEVRVDDGPWQAAMLAEEHARTTWRQWRLAWTPSRGRHTISVRATETDGVTQTEEAADPAPDGATGWHTIGVIAS